MARLLVLVTSTVFPPHMGGQKATVLFYEALKKYHQVFFALTADNETENIDFETRKLLFTNRRMPLNIFKLPALVSLIKKKKIGLVIAEHSYTAWLAVAAKRVTGVPFIIRSHNIDAHRFRQLRRWWWKQYLSYERWAHRQAAYSFFISEEDKGFAELSFHLNANHCSVVRYGVDRPAIIRDAKHNLKDRFALGDGPLFYFNGTLNYGPNAEAITIIIDIIQPLLKAQNDAATILISGRNIAEDVEKKIAFTKQIRYVGFVDDTATIYQGCDAFINPVTSNAGVKTKLVEALANNCTVVSTNAGLGGITSTCFGDKILICENNHWPQFVERMMEAIALDVHTPALFFNQHSWKEIAAGASATIQNLLPND